MQGVRLGIGRIGIARSEAWDLEGRDWNLETGYLTRSTLWKRSAD